MTLSWFCGFGEVHCLDVHWWKATVDFTSEFIKSNVIDTHQWPLLSLSLPHPSPHPVDRGPDGHSLSLQM